MNSSVAATVKPKAAPQGTAAFTLHHNGIADRLISDVSVSVAFDHVAPPTPPPIFLRKRALWDTGATKSVITERTARDLNLVPVGSTIVTHAGGSSRANTYLVNFILPNAVGIQGVMVSECPEINGPDVIIGMDVISQGDLSLTNEGGKTTMSFRTPAQGGTDYVADINRQRFAHIGRNDPCPCGAKKSDGTQLKFKHCHGR